MFAKLDRLRAEHKKALQKLEEAQKKVDETAARVKEEEATEVLNIVADMNWTPEQLSEFVKQKKNADKPTFGAGGNGFIKKNEEKREGNTNE
ncbi:DUF4315 family protein [Butyrivibrio sp.]|uniref:DUF4315 family protein n=1 Tax=Butyrivibrio sp. TaxID=28121 RepID=UPI0025BBF169|nr:DUF4315 family protein [Butyrivibrio sp.]MBE5837985.1 DUF4315 family protein [Butyrivibrio sp.]